MSPLHHHFELCGWSEWRVVTTFWFFGLVLAGLGVFLEMWL
jgi:phospho-N-acetylmuramoyl-pentapeptide-transferase